MDSQILLADDEPTILRLLLNVLENAGHSTLTASSSTEAVDIFLQQTDQIVALVLDVNLPPGGAEEVLEAVLARRPEIPYLIVSGKPLDEPLASQVAQSPTCHFLPKPFRTAELLAWVEALP